MALSRETATAKFKTQIQANVARGDAPAIATETLGKEIKSKLMAIQLV